MRDRAYFENLIVEKMTETVDGEPRMFGEVAFIRDRTLFVGQTSDENEVNYAVVVYRGGTATRTVQPGRYTGTFRFGVFVHVRRRDALMAVLDDLEVALLELAPAACETGPEDLVENARTIVCEVEFDA